jgi:hypothetical protein
MQLGPCGVCNLPTSASVATGKFYYRVVLGLKMRDLRAKCLKVPSGKVRQYAIWRIDGNGPVTSFPSTHGIPNCHMADWDTIK